MALANYLHNYLKGLASQLGWTVEAGSYDSVVALVLEDCEVSTEAEEKNLVKLHRIGVYRLYEAILREISFDVNISIDGGNISREQAFQNITQLFNQAYNDALPYLPGSNAIEINYFSNKRNPYVFLPYQDRV
jgi:hypothetical protein